eukprot:2956732-Pleurochrysis_carterae.AAC.1
MLRASKRFELGWATERSNERAERRRTAQREATPAASLLKAGSRGARACGARPRPSAAAPATWRRAGHRKTRPHS